MREKRTLYQNLSLQSSIILLKAFRYFSRKGTKASASFEHVRFVIKINSISESVQTNYTNVGVCVGWPSVCGKQKKTTSEILVIKINRSGERRRRAGRRLVGRQPPSSTANPPHTYLYCIRCPLSFILTPLTTTILRRIDTLLTSKTILDILTLKCDSKPVWTLNERAHRTRQADAGVSRGRRGRFPAKRRLFLFLRRGKKSARARPAPPKHAPRSDADSAGCVPNSLSFATSHRFSKVTVQRAVHVWRGRVLAAALADRLGEWVNFAPSSSSVTFPSRLSAPVSHGPSPCSGRRWKWMCFAGDGSRRASRPLFPRMTWGVPREG